MAIANDPGRGVGLGIGGLRLWYPVVGSTMDVAALLAHRGAPHGTVVWADYQHAGRGRQGRIWDTTAGSALLSSWILRYPEDRADMGALSPLVALAIIRAVHHVAPHAPATLKWPNDVLLDNKKVAGVLLTARPSRDGGVVIVGIGLNVHANAIPPGIDGASISEWHQSITADRMLDVIGQFLNPMWSSFMEHGCITGYDLDAINDFMAWRHERVSLQVGEETLGGQATGIAADGSMLFQHEERGEILRLRVGEIIRGPRRVGSIE